MSKLTQHFITAVLVALVCFLIHLNHQCYKIREKENSLIQNDLQHQLDSTESQLKQTQQQRDSLVRYTIDLNRTREALITRIRKKDEELRSIKGRYDSVSQDSLARLMEERAK